MSGLALQVFRRRSAAIPTRATCKSSGVTGATWSKILWHDGLGTSLYAKRLERGRFIWPTTVDGAAPLTMGQLGYLLEGVDWRDPQATWRPEKAG